MKSKKEKNKNTNEECCSFDEETIIDAEKLEDEEFENIENDGITEEDIVSLEGIVEELRESNKMLDEENKKLENELEVMKERILRTASEYENFRKRTAKEKEGIYTDACEDVLKNMIPVLDSLEMAVKVEGNVEDIKKGIDMTIRQFKESLEKLQVEEVQTTEGFDPNIHNAVMHVEDEAFGKNEVVEVFQKGYKRGNKVLRYSMVKVAN